jgi:TonB-linked SusC/RagA family outer membrane protein
LRHTCYRLTRATARLVVALALGAVPGAALLAPSLAAQELQPAQAPGRITGSITGEGGQPLIAAQVTLVGTRFGAVTREDGRFTIADVPAGTYTLRAQRIGYAPNARTVTVAGGETVTADVVLTPVPTALTASVAVGYTTQVRRDVSDAVSSVSSEDIADQASATVEEALRGRVPGVQINASGEPGRPAQVFIRGQNFLGPQVPLYVVDGMYMRQNPNLNPEDIESIDVLKDASAAAQYGAQAANGVIVIRTKRGRPGENNRVELRSYVGTQDIPSRIDMMNARGWATIQEQAYLNAGLPVPSGVTEALSGTPNANTDWQDAVFRRGRIMDHNLTVSGGSENASYLISGGLLDQEGAVVETDFRRLSVRVNSQLDRGRLTLGENIAVSRSTGRELSGFPLIDVVRMLPTVPVRDTNNPFGYGYGSGSNPTFGTNPIGLLERRPRDRRSNQVIGSGFGELELLPNLRYRLNLGINYESFARSEFNSIAQIRQASPNQFAELTEIRNDFTSLLAENLLTFDDQFGEGDHRINVVGGFTEQVEDADDISAYRRGFSDEDLRTINAGEEANASNSGTLRRTVLQSWLARANYTLFDRYLFTGSMRRDASSRFGPNNRWGTFSAASVGWIVSDESFFQSTPFLNRASFLKLRASTGTLGNQDIGDYRFQGSIEQNRLGYTFGGQQFPGASQLAFTDPNIRWQENEQTNVGFDLGLLDDRFSLTADIYRSTSKGLLVTIPIPWSLGGGEDNARRPVVNAGSMRNSGTELGLSYRYGGGADGAFRLNTTATLTTTRNRVLSLGGGEPLFDETGVARTAVGQPLGTFFVVRTAGIFQTPEDVQAHTTTLGDGTVRVIQPTAQPGDIRYVDANGDGQINDDDRVGVGNGTPKFSGGLFFDGGYGAFDFSVNLRGAGGFKIFNVARYWTDRMDDPSNYREGFEPWTPTNRSTTTPRALAVGNPNTRFNSDRWIEDGDYLRIQNIVIGYVIPTSLTQRLGVSQATESRVYLNMQNVHTFTDFSNWDPETLGFGNPLGRGIDDGRIYPNVRTISFGVDLRL